MQKKVLNRFAFCTRRQKEYGRTTSSEYDGTTAELRLGTAVIVRNEICAKWIIYVEQRSISVLRMLECGVYV